jgi:hypothetical protein
MSGKVDLYREHREEYAAGAKPRLVEIGPAVYLAVEGKGPPGGEEFQDRIGALYAVAYTVKMTRKFEERRDYVVCKLEGQYWSPGGGFELGDASGDDLRWRLLIRTPDFVGEDEISSAIGKLREKGKTPSVREVRLKPLEEGTCVQMLHVGPYESEPETIAAMRELMTAEGLAQCGPHHEVYLSDPRRVPPERLRTVLRIPVS